MYNKHHQLSNSILFTSFALIGLEKNCAFSLSETLFSQIHNKRERWLENKFSNGEWLEGMRVLCAFVGQEAAKILEVIFRG